MNRCGTRPTTRFPAVVAGARHWLADTASRAPLCCVVALALVTGAIQMLTIRISPPVWQDEVQIVDYGRVLFPGADRSHAVSLHADGRPILLLNYMGALIQECACRLAGGDMAGPRLSSVIGAMVGAIAIAGWCMKRKLQGGVAVLAAMIFLWDPLFVQSYRGARPDSWCIGFMLLALWAVGGRTRQWWLLVVAGVMVAASGLTWASSVLLLPLLLHELIAPAWSGGDGEPLGNGRLREVLISTFLVGASALVALILFLSPYRDDLPRMLGDLRGGIDTVVTKDSGSLAAGFGRLLPIWARTPLLPMAAVAALVARGPRTWLVACGLAAIGVAATTLYAYRCVYLVPYFVCGLALAMGRLTASHGNAKIGKPLFTAAAMVVLVWGGAMTLLARPAMALLEQDRRDPRHAEQVAVVLDDIGPGRMHLGQWNLYYALRSHGWRFDGPFDRRPREVVAAHLDYDVVVMDGEGRAPSLVPAVEERGFSRFCIRPVTSGKNSWLSKNTPGYGPYEVWLRPGLALQPGRHDGEAVIEEPERQ